ncbi:MAG: phosphonoacetate hydrolase [Phycisphaeraceae bacterium]|nr:phosphonoacetate hydrolase [Phycisphaeraceae bacterium]
MIATESFEANGKTYRPPARPIVVMCLDGCGDEYLSAALARDRMPNLGAMVVRGYRGMVRGALPSFTNVNNASIVTGVPPSRTGISGNFFLDPVTGEAVMMNSSQYLRCPTILAAAAAAGRKVAMVTAKDKLCSILSHGLGDAQAICFSAEKANEAKEATHGIGDVEQIIGHATPPIYSAAASVYVFRAGVALVAEGRADFLYLSLTDYIQHKHAPEAPEALDFLASLDLQLGRLLELGAVVGATADHGMNAKNRPDGNPNVVYLQTMLDERFGSGHRVVCPITDPYVRHHGGLGSLVSVHVDPGTPIDQVADWISALAGITEVHDRQAAARRMELPADRIGDLVALSGRDVVIGVTPDDHDLSLLEGGLRSHGGRYEDMVPLLLSEPLNDAYRRKAECDPRNFDVFDFTCNGGAG